MQRHPSILSLLRLLVAVAIIPLKDAVVAKRPRDSQPHWIPPLPEADVKLMWFSPIVVQPLPEPPSFANTLAKAAVELFESFMDEATTGDVDFSLAAAALRQVVCSGDRSCAAGEQWRRHIEPQDVNNAFFKFQRQRSGNADSGGSGGAWDRKTGALGSLPEVARLKYHLFAAAAKVRASVGIAQEDEEEPPPQERAGSPDDLFCWCSVHGEASVHLAHTHPSNELSAVFFAAAPTAAGELKSRSYAPGGRVP